MKKQINVAIIGAQFMGRAHSNAWYDVSRFYELPFEVKMKTICDIDPASGRLFAKKYGWERFEQKWENVVNDPGIDVIDICTPNNLHHTIAVAAAKAGKHIICEKPLAMNTGEAKMMFETARKSGVKNLTAFNYRRVPAIILGKQLIEAGKIGRVFHFNAVYYQDWLVDPEFPYVWRHDVKAAGSGAHGDLNAHTVDLAHFLIGEIDSVCGERKVFIEDRNVPGTNQKAKVTADDATMFMAKFQSGAIGNFIATRFASGRKNYLRLEIFGSRGSLVFNLERMNELEFYSDDDVNTEQGFRTILVTESSHPYIKKWWPSGHIIGWEHTFIHEIGDFLLAIANNSDIKPDFYDGYLCQLVLDAVSKSSEQKSWIQILT